MATKKRIYGTSAADILTGTTADEALYSYEGNDKLQGGGGNDDIYGGDGIDIAIFSGAFSEYDFSNPSGGGLRVTHARGTKADGSDFVSSDTEILKFSDRSIDLRINHKPVALADTNGSDVVVERGGVANGTVGDAVAVGNVLLNDIDIEKILHRQTLVVANPGTYVGVFGSLILRANGSWRYTLNDSDADTQRLAQGTFGRDVFSYTASDGAGGLATGRLTVTIKGTNDAPVITSSATAASGKVIEAGSRANGTIIPGTPVVSRKLTASDPDAGATATWSISGPSIYGTMSIDQSGTWTYTLDNARAATQALARGDVKTETFTATVTDDKGATATKLVTITINGADDLGTPVNTVKGDWSDVFSWPIIGVHLAMTSDGKILSFGSNAAGIQSGLHIYDVWDPVTKVHTTLQHTTHSDIFCSVALIDPATGNIIIIGGDARPDGQANFGISDVNVFNPNDLSLTHSSTGSIAFPRWYATSVELGNGQIVVLGGRDGTPTTGDPHYNAYSEIYTPGYGFRTLTGAYIDQFTVVSNYPRSWLTSDGHIWTFSDTSSDIFSIDPTGIGSVTKIGALPTKSTWTAPSIMYAPDKVLLLGDDGSAWKLDLSGAAPSFIRTDDAGPGRLWSNLTVLADGRVMLSGGSAVYNALTGVNNTVEIWDPQTGHWTAGDTAAIPRLYHSATILLADGTVLSEGGGAPGPVNNTNAEIYSPTYLFDATGAAAVRPLITSAPKDLNVGDSFTVKVADPDSIKSLALMMFNSVTHSFNETSQRIELAFAKQSDGSLKMTLPDNPNILKPGYWMLFAINNAGTPSIASTIEIHSEAAQYFPDRQALLGLDSPLQFRQNGAAAYDGYSDAYALTPADAPDKFGTVFSQKRVDLSKAFDITFEINVGSLASGGEGLAFILQNSAEGSGAAGTSGAGLGALSIDNGIAIQFDTNRNASDAGDIANDHTSFFVTKSGALASTVKDLGNFEDGNWHTVHVTWTGQTLSYSFDGAPAGSLTQNLATTYFGGSQYAYFGFSGSTGTTTAYQQVSLDQVTAAFEDGTTIDVDRDDSPLSPTFKVNGSASPDTNRYAYTLTPDAANMAGGVMTTDRVDLTKSFDLRFEIDLGNKDANGGEGVAFVIQNDPNGSSALGGNGGGLGAIGISNGLAVLFDTAQSSGEIANDHASLVRTANGVAITSAIADLGNIEDGNWHAVHVTWDGQTLVYSFDGVQIGSLTQDISANILGGSRYAYLGFTGATGTLTENEHVRVQRFDATAESGHDLHMLGSNTAPVAGNDVYSVAANGTLTVDAAHGLLVNDTDADGDELNICGDSRVIPHVLLLQPDNGTVVVEEDGSFVYTPNAGFVGIDHFNYCSEDGPACTQGLVTINVTGGDGVTPAFRTNGSATLDAGINLFSLTPDSANVSGSVMATDRVDLSKSFDVQFEINVGNKDANGADGLAFVIQNDASGSAALGGSGGALGAIGITKGLGVFFDTYQGPGEIANDHMSFVNTADGSAASPSVFDLGNIEDGNWHAVHIAWDGHTLTASFDGVQAGSLSQDISADFLAGSQYAYLGFTGATGGLSEHEQVHLVSFDATSESGAHLNSLAAGSGPNTITGDNADNILNGTAGADQIVGFNGNDTLIGNDGNDILSGGEGQDSLTGGNGNDLFVYKPGFGQDTITDFGSTVAGNHDVVDLTAFHFSSPGEALSHATGVGYDTVFNFGNGDLLTVKNTASGIETGSVTNLIITDLRV